MRKIILLFFFLASIQGLKAQKRYIDKAIETGRNDGLFYKVNLEKGKILKEAKLVDYCNKNNIIVRNIGLKSINRFGDKDLGVRYFEFLPKSEVEKYVFDKKISKSCDSASKKAQDIRYKLFKGGVQ